MTVRSENVSAPDALHGSQPASRPTWLHYELWKRTGGKAWEPGDPHHPQIVAMIDGGWLKRCQMRCGFEAFNTGVTWTDAARAALQSAQSPAPVSCGNDGERGNLAADPLKAPEDQGQ